MPATLLRFYLACLAGLSLTLAAGAARPRTPTTSITPMTTTIAPVPPLGWNSYDCFGDSVTEDEVLANAKYMAEHLARFGWQYVVVDYRWYNPEARSTIANLDPRPNLVDEYGRLVPAPNRFPSAANGQGFKPIADKVHAMGLKFGIHVMRGISKNALSRNLPIEGSRFHAADAADPESTCWWSPDMVGVKGDTEAGQAWYDSLLRQYAAWGVDFIKVDDLSAPAYHKSEVEAIRRAIDKCGRPIVFSTSPGETPLDARDHVMTHANMWRMQNDVWDNWREVDNTFNLGAAWSSAAGPGHWPDADMLPLGHLALRSVGEDRRCRLSRDEQVTMLTLWCVLPSPLMVGANLPDNDPWTLSLLTNEEALAVDQDPLGEGAQRVWKRGHLEAWTRNLSNGDRAIALFNRGTAEEKFSLAPQALGLAGAWKARDLWRHADLPAFSGARPFTLPPHGTIFLRLSPLPQNRTS